MLILTCKTRRQQPTKCCWQSFCSQNTDYAFLGGKGQILPSMCDHLTGLIEILPCMWPCLTTCDRKNEKDTALTQSGITHTV